jgi:hypothetical protein
MGARQCNVDLSSDVEAATGVAGAAWPRCLGGWDTLASQGVCSVWEPGRQREQREASVSAWGTGGWATT